MFMHFMKACFPVSKVSTLQSHETSEEPFSDATDHGGSNHSAKVEPANGCTGERETGNSAKKPVVALQSF
ncbi:hypothetical protein Pyn_29769 [Prunus yedoensis var. nudiflora]|uniref:Uncharacterized protein n=1 Tax=Prunus yedoensis var. nudiflora TaxID=2094558 RepID=A0A314XKW7_PRUYE|nr:hypothetical protein Pyn_29769 [Prunus yedoensis var. nudiflora]